jgi:DNA polymerase
MSQNKSVREKAIDYLDFLAHYEKELFLESQPPFLAPPVSEAVKPAVAQPKPGELDPHPAHSPYKSLEQMDVSIRGCLRCALGSARNKFVFGAGSAEAKVVFIGEAPGAEEDRQGYPFVGRAGKLLDHMLGEIGWSRDDVYICNILKCRPPNNRDPLPEEIAQCEPYLHEQLRILNAQWLVALGRVAAQTLLRTTASLGSMRGRIHHYRDKPFWVTYHPAALLRNQNLMPHAHQDLLTLKKMVEEGQTQTPGELL